MITFIVVGLKQPAAGPQTQGEKQLGPIATKAGEAARAGPRNPTTSDVRKVTAPAPRRVPLNRPPEGYASTWQRCGDIETRVVGAKLTRPTLEYTDGRELLARSPMFVVWIETRAAGDDSIALRRWMNAFEPRASIRTQGGQRLVPAPLPAGAVLGGQLMTDFLLVPGGRSNIDVAAFEPPPADTRTLFLTLDAKHVRQMGSFVHAIPSEVWGR